MPQERKECFMKDDIIRSLSAVLQALNSVQVSGKGNLANLSGSISVIEDVIAKVNMAEITEKKDEKKK